MKSAKGCVERGAETGKSGAITKLIAKLGIARTKNPRYDAGMVKVDLIRVSLRPLQLRANSEDAAFMMPAAKALSQRYSKLKIPITIITGAQDEVINFQAHSTRLHRELPQSELHVVPDTGHMVHYVAQEKIVATVDTEKPSQNRMVDTPYARGSNGSSPQPTAEATHPFKTITDTPLT